MKKLILPVVAMLLCMTACKKEENGILRLEVEHYNSDAKMHIDDDDFAVWDNDDVVYLNGQECHVYSPYGDAASITFPRTLMPPYYASYPYQATHEAGYSDYTITLPAVQKYRTNGSGQQIVDAPMAAFSADGNKLKFRNIGSILALKVISSSTIKVTNIEVSANKPLCGDISFQSDINNSTYTLSSCSNGGYSVTLMGINENVSSTGKIYYIALPAVNDAKFTIKVYTQESGFYYSYTRTQSGTVSFDKNTIHEVPFTLNTNERSSVDLFSITGTAKVSFAPGNCQYINGAESYYSDPWMCKTSQSFNDCDLVGFDGDASYGRTIYTTYSYTGQINDRYGIYNKVLSKDEWDYVFSNRTNAVTFNGTSKGTVRWVRANVSSVNGVILFPDGVVILNVPGKSLSTPGSFLTTTTSDNTFTADEWNNVFKPMGCVFLPALGNGTSGLGTNCLYWTSTTYYNKRTRTTTAYRIKVTSSDEYSSDAVALSTSLPRRLVKDR